MSRILLQQHRQIIPGSQCLCHITDYACNLGLNCPFSETELVADVAPDPERVIHEAPVDVDPVLRARTWRVLAVISVAIVAAVVWVCTR